MWFKVDDKLHDHRKARVAKKAAMGVWVLAGSWCMDNGTDGFVPADVLTRWGNRADASALVRAGLWIEATRDGEKGWQFHDWAHFQPPESTVSAWRAAESDAGKRGNHQRWHVARAIADPACEYCRVPDQVPDDPPDQEPDRVSIGSTIGSASPVTRYPIPTSNEVGANRRVPDATSGDEGTDQSPTQKLVAEWLEHCQQRPPSRVIGQVARELKILVGDGIDPATIRAGLAAWSAKRLHPSTLASVVHEHQAKAGPRTQPDGSRIDENGIRYFADGTVDESTLPPVEDNGMRLRS